MPKQNNYRPRVVDDVLNFKLKTLGGVLIEGPKWCGKTTTAAQAAKSILYLDEPSSRQQNLEMADLNPSRLLEGDTPRLLDEWQLAPNLWDAARFEIDRRATPGQFILTGSSTPADSAKIFHSGTGRFSRLQMAPMSLYESGESDGSVKLSELVSGATPSASAPDSSLDQLAFATCRGGWPAAIEQPDEVALALASEYVDLTIHRDVSRVDQTQRDAEKVRRVMRSYARLQGNPAPLETIVSDVATDEGVEISRDTISAYLNSLRKIFVIHDVPAWSPNLRSKTAIRTTETRYFVDPSIATAVLGLNPEGLIADLRLFGFVFETLCLRDLRIYAEPLNAKIYHYRDRRGYECDAVLVMPNGEYGLIEIKLGGDEAINQAAKNLRRIADDLTKAPLFSMVLTGNSAYAYTRADGVHVVPVRCLGV